VELIRRIKDPKTRDDEIMKAKKFVKDVKVLES